MRGVAAAALVLVTALAAADEPQAVDALFAQVDSTRTPGCSVAVIRDGAIVYARGYGMADLDHGIVNTPATVFHVASMAKQFTAASILLLAREGKLGLDDEVRRYVPELPDFGVPITIRHVIHHTSGLRDQWELLTLAGWRYSLDLITDRDVLAVVSRQKDLNFAPGSQYNYSNTGYTLLARIVARVSGQSFREFTTARLFAPLGMAHTFFRDDHAEIVPNIAYGYEPAGTTFKLSVTNFDTVGATSLLTTVEDLARWDENFYAPKVGDDAFVAGLLQTGVLVDGRPLDYAFGLVVGDYRGQRTVGHAGADAGYRSDMLRFPDRRSSVACLCNVNAMNPSELTRKIADIYLGSLLDDATATAKGRYEPTPAELTAMSGSYLELTRGNQVLKLGVVDGKLLAKLAGNPPIELVPDAKHTFHLSIAPDVTLAFRGRGDAREVTVTVPNQPGQRFAPIPESHPTAEQLADYTGQYTSDEVDMRYHVGMADTGLVLRALKLDPIPLQPLAPDLFGSEFGTLRFARDASGAVSGYKLNTLRTSDFVFRKSAGR